MFPTQSRPPDGGRPRHRLPTRAPQIAKALLLAAVMALLASPSAPHFTLPKQSAGSLQITLSAGLFPTFNAGISDYVYLAPSTSGGPVQVSVNAPRNTKVSVDGQPYQKLSFTTSVNLKPGQSFPIAVSSPTGTNTYYVRCLPTDFPTWTVERPGTPPDEYYFITPDIPLNGGPLGNYAILADDYGVPIWWYRNKNGSPTDAKLLPDGNFGWIGASTDAEEHRLDGSVVHAIMPPSPAGAIMDNHEIQMLPNGDFVFIVDLPRGPVDLSAEGGSKTATVLDNIIEEVTPSGSLVWSWSALDHIRVSQTEPEWWQFYLVNSKPADPFHMNAIQQDNAGSGFLVSLRHLDAIIHVNKATGNITWKLGGTILPQSLSFVGDPYGNFGGQHDVRQLPDRTITLHDNGTLKGRPPRGVRYRIDTATRTATFIEQIMDPNVPSSGCCGSARKRPDGAWVMSWGENPIVTALNPGGQRLFRLTFKGEFSYRANPVPFGVLSRAALRAGMDAQYPR